MLSKNLSKLFGKMSLGKRNEKLCRQTSTIFISIVLNSFMKNLLMTKSKDLKQFIHRKVANNTKKIGADSSEKHKNRERPKY